MAVDLRDTPFGNPGDTRAVLRALQRNGAEVLKGKGGFWLKGEGFITLAEARRRTGVEAPKRERRERVQAWGEYAWVAGVNRAL